MAVICFMVYVTLWIHVKVMVDVEQYFEADLWPLFCGLLLVKCVADDRCYTSSDALFRILYYQDGLNSNKNKRGESVGYGCFMVVHAMAISYIITSALALVVSTCYGKRPLRSSKHEISRLIGRAGSCLLMSDDQL